MGGTPAKIFQKPAEVEISCDHACHQNRTVPSTEPGTDYATPYNTLLAAAYAGKVVDIKSTNDYATGRYVTIDLDNGMRVRYLHLSRILTTVGARVKKGQIFALSGASGWGSDWGYGAHVHVTLWQNQSYSFGKYATLDFEDYLEQEEDMPTAKEIVDEMMSRGMGGGFTFQEAVRADFWQNTEGVSGQKNDGKQVARLKQILSTVKAIAAKEGITVSDVEDAVTNGLDAWWSDPSNIKLVADAICAQLDITANVDYDKIAEAVATEFSQRLLG